MAAVEVVRHLLAVQAQDLRAARLALRARSEGLTAADVNKALTEERSLVVAWLGRGTLHLVAAEDYPWLLALTAPTRLTNNHRRLGQEGVSPDDAERAVRVIERALFDEGPLTRAELAERIAMKGIRTEGQATPHLLMLAALRGISVIAPVRDDGTQAFALTRDWLGEQPEVDRDTALAELSRRYLRAHSPAGDADLAAWIGLPLRDVRRGFSQIEEEPAVDHIPPRLLPAFDPYLLGWKDRSFAVPEKRAKRVHPGGGMIRATATVDGLVVGTWTAKGIEAFDPLDPAEETALEAERTDIERFETEIPGGAASSITGR